MAKQSKVKSSKKFVTPVFYFQNKEDNDVYITKAVIKTVRKTGQLNLSGKHLSDVPQKLFTIYDADEDSDTKFDFNQSKNDEEWWNLLPLTYLDLSSNVLKSIPSQIEIFQDLSILNLQDNNLSSLPKEIFTLVKLTKLNLNRNKLAVLDKRIGNFRDLKFLTINQNCLEEIPVEVSDLVMLEMLDLSNNKITELPPGIGFLIRLTEINLSNNKLTNLPPDIVNLRALIKLEIRQNSVEELPSMGELRKLQFLYASHNDIKSIPDFEGCTNLQEIYLSNNFIKEIPDIFFENLSHLKILELRDNQISKIPEEFSAPHLVKLNLTNNELTSLPNCLSMQPHLQSLNIEGNKLKQIRTDIIKAGTTRILRHLRDKVVQANAETVFEEKCIPDKYAMKNSGMLFVTMKNITELPQECFQDAKEANVSSVDLCKNKLSKVPLGLDLLSEHISELNISCNQLKVLPDSMGTFQKLKYINLCNNHLCELPESMSSLVYLRELALSANKFSNIPNCIYDMVEIEILLLNDNKICEINVEGLKKLTRIAVLDLSNNNINHIPPELGNIKQLRKLELIGNSFRQPRYAILEQGTESILAYLRDRIPK